MDVRKAMTEAVGRATADDLAGLAEALRGPAGTDAATVRAALEAFGS